MSVSLKIVFYNIYFKDVKSFYFKFKVSTEFSLSIFSQCARDLQFITSPVNASLYTSSLVLSDPERSL